MSRLQHVEGGTFFETRCRSLGDGCCDCMSPWAIIELFSLSTFAERCRQVWRQLNLHRHSCSSMAALQSSLLLSTATADNKTASCTACWETLASTTIYVSKTTTRSVFRCLLYCIHLYACSGLSYYIHDESKRLHCPLLQFPLQSSKLLERCNP